MEIQNTAYDRLHKALVKDFKSNALVTRMNTLMNTWLRTFRKSRFVKSDEKVAMRLSHYPQDAKALVGELKRTYGEEIGSVDTLVDAIENGRAIGQAQGYDHLVGIKIHSVYEGVTLILEMNLNTSMIPSQSIFIDDESVVQQLDSYRTVGTLYRTVFPVGQMFEPSIFGNILDTIDAVQEDEDA